MRISKPEIKSRFGLEEWPFGRPSKLDPFPSKALARIGEAVRHAIDEKEFIAVIGEIGSGKTTAVYDALEREKTRRSNLHVIDVEDLQTSRLSPPKIRAAFKAALGIDKYLHGSCGYAILRKTLYDLHKNEHKVVMVCDEAHQLSAEALRALKNMHEWKVGRAQGFLSIILIGQAVMTANFRFSARDVLERLQALNLYEMKPLLPHEVRAYVGFRIERAGGKNFFEAPALRLLSKSAETPLAVNRIAALMAAHAVESSAKKKTVTLADAEKILDFTGRRALDALANKGFTDAEIRAALKAMGVDVSRSAVNAIRHCKYGGSAETERRVLDGVNRFAQKHGITDEKKKENTA